MAAVLQSCFTLARCLVVLLQSFAAVNALLFLALKQNDTTTLANVILVLVLAIVSLALCGRRLYATRVCKPLRCAGDRWWCLTWAGIHYLPLFWLAVAVFGLCITVKHPVCPATTPQTWRPGLACTIHRGIVAVSVLITLGQYIQDRLQAQCQPQAPTDATPSTKSMPSTESILSLEKAENEQIYLVPGPPATKEQQRYLQRRNSLSSQRAVYPTYPYGHSNVNRRSASFSYTPNSKYARSTLRSVSDSSLMDRTASFTSISAPSSSGSIYSRRRPGLDPNCPAIPESPRLIEPPSAPPPAWCPPLRHAPLSADPAIRALTDTVNPQPSLVQSATWPLPPPPPKLPSRAPGHVARVSTGTRMALRKPSPIRYRQQKLWSYGNNSPAGEIINGRLRPSMYSQSSYGTSLRSSAYTIM